jgi:hypothetical protein
MNSEPVENIAARIARLEVEELRIPLLIQFPPPGCRNIESWRQMQTEKLASLRQMLGAQRELLDKRQKLPARLSIQSELNF